MGASLLIPSISQIRLLADLHCSLAGNWIFPFRRWLDPSSPEDYRTLCLNYIRICEEVQDFKTCSRERFFKVLSDPGLLSSRQVGRTMRVCPERKRAGAAIPYTDAKMVVIVKIPPSSPSSLHNLMSAAGPELGRPSFAAGNAGEEVDLALFKHWAGAALHLRAVDEEELERFGRSTSV